MMCKTMMKNRFCSQDRLGVSPQIKHASAWFLQNLVFFLESNAASFSPALNWSLVVFRNLSLPMEREDLIFGFIKADWLRYRCREVCAKSFCRIHMMLPLKNSKAWWIKREEKIKISCITNKIMFSTEGRKSGILWGLEAVCRLLIISQ